MKKRETDGQLREGNERRTHQKTVKTMSENISENLCVYYGIF